MDEFGKSIGKLDDEDFDDNGDDDSEEE